MPRQRCPLLGRLPAAPLLARMPGDSVLGKARLMHGDVWVNHRRLRRWCQYGLSLHQADAAACAIDLHPLNVWGDAWSLAEDWMDEAWLVEVKKRTVSAYNALERRRWAA